MGENTEAYFSEVSGKRAQCNSVAELGKKSFSVSKAPALNTYIVWLYSSIDAYMADSGGDRRITKDEDLATVCFPDAKS